MRIAILDGLLTLFYDGSELYDEDLYYEWIEEKRRKKGDEQNMQVSPACRDFIYERWSWQQVIVLDGVKEIPMRTFLSCKNIKRVIFSDSSCKELRSRAFVKNKNLTLFNVAEDAFLGGDTFEDTNMRNCSNEWVKNLNNGEHYSLHRACCSSPPNLQVICNNIWKKGGLQALNLENKNGITPSQYLRENPYTDLTEIDIIRHFIAWMMRIMGDYNHS